eukprot:TRINITY_DN22297_c0_g1_i1.p1 TRINITY_DN22297_c0_g1~~TRINITY_DN22297_c0_g1_i1.p1  ORF type:complete len:193 (-),score=18.42 TRINITY_DN22297_c0_g1_i1:29-574(-)
MPTLKPHHADIVWRDSIEKELQTWCLATVGLSAETTHDDLKNGPQEQMPTAFHIPAAGQRVIIRGSRRRPELNGAQAEVIGTGADEQGRVTVRVFRSSLPHDQDKKGSWRMQIRASNLVPMEVPKLHHAEATRPSDASDAASVRSCSSRGSVGSRSLLRGTGLSALSGSASLLKLPPVSEH